MSNSFAVNGYGYGIDPYFLQAYNFNPSFMGSTGAAAQTTAAQQTANTSQNFALPAPEEEGSNAGLILGAGTVIAGAAATIMAFRKGKAAGAEGTLKQIGKGFEMMWNSVKGKVTQTPRQQFRMEKVGENWVCDIPNRSRSIKSGEQELLNNLGIQIGQAPKLGEKGVDIIQYRMNYNGDTIVVRGNKIVAIKNSSGDDILKNIIEATEGSNLAYKNELESVIAKIKAGKLNEIKNYKLSDILYKHTSDGVAKRYTMANQNAEAVLHSVRTNKYLHTDETAQAYGLRNKTVGEAFERINKKKLPKGLKAQMKYKTADGTVIVSENGKITGIIDTNNKFHAAGTDKFIVWESNNKQAIEKFKNVDKTKDDGIQSVVYTE